MWSIAAIVAGGLTSLWRIVDLGGARCSSARISQGNTNQAHGVFRAVVAWALLAVAAVAQAAMGGPSYSGQSVNWGVSNIGAGDRLHHKVAVTQPGRSPQVVFDAPDSNTGPGERSVKVPGILQGAVIEVEVLIYPPAGQEGPPQLVAGKTIAP